jgi:hypothetical protein
MLQNLRAPPISTVLSWGKKLGLTHQESEKVSDKLRLRHQLAPDIGTNSKRVKKITPKSHASPYFSQGDLGKKPIIKQKNIFDFFCIKNTFLQDFLATKTNDMVLFTALYNVLQEEFLRLKLKISRHLP